jgi:hypothetical protein
MVLAKFATYERRFAAEDHRPTGYEPQPVRWVVELHSDGTPVGGSLGLAIQSQSFLPWLTNVRRRQGRLRFRL